MFIIAIPVLNEDITTKITSTGGAEIEVTFSTMLEDNEVEFTKNGQTLLNSNKYSSASRSVFFVTRSGDMHPKGARLISRKATHTLIINDLEEADFGPYKVIIRNFAGVAEGSLILRRPPGNRVIHLYMLNTNTPCMIFTEL